jgi:hypothetical protein
MAVRKQPPANCQMQTKMPDSMQMNKPAIHVLKKSRKAFKSKQLEFLENTNLALEYIRDEFEDDFQETDTFTCQLAIAF